MDLPAQYLTFKTSYAKYLVTVCINECSPHNNEKFDGCLMIHKLFSYNIFITLRKQ